MRKGRPVCGISLITRRSILAWRLQAGGAYVVKAMSYGASERRRGGVKKKEREMENGKKREDKGRRGRKRGKRKTEMAKAGAIKIPVMIAFTYLGSRPIFFLGVCFIHFFFLFIIYIEIDAQEKRTMTLLNRLKCSNPILNVFSHTSLSLSLSHYVHKMSKISLLLTINDKVVEVGPRIAVFTSLFQAPSFRLLPPRLSCVYTPLGSRTLGGYFPVIHKSMQQAGAVREFKKNTPHNEIKLTLTTRDKNVFFFMIRSSTAIEAAYIYIYQQRQLHS